MKFAIALAPLARVSADERKQRLERVSFINWNEIRPGAEHAVFRVLGDGLVMTDQKPEQPGFSIGRSIYSTVLPSARVSNSAISAIVMLGALVIT